jgi:hypothetical protein
MITRWPYHVRDRHAGKITIYGWSTSNIDALCGAPPSDGLVNETRPAGGLDVTISSST